MIAQCDHDPDAPDCETLFNATLVSRQFLYPFNKLLWQTVDFRRLGQEESLDKLLSVLVDKRTSSECRNSIKRIVFPADMSCDIDVLSVLVSGMDWISSHYSAGFKTFLRAQICKRPNADDSMLAMLLVLAPGLESLCWERNGGYLAIEALFTYRHHASGVLKTSILAKLKDLEFSNKPFLDPFMKLTPEIRPFFFFHNLTHVVVKNVQSYETGLPIKENLPLNNHLQNSRLVSLELSSSMIGVDLFDLVLRSSPNLECLVLNDHFFRLRSDQTSIIMTTEQLGDSLRSHGHSLEHLEIRHSQRHPFRLRLSEHGYLGPLRNLKSLKSIVIDGCVLADHTIGVSVHSPIVLHVRGYLPAGIEELVLLPLDHINISSAIHALQWLQAGSDLPFLCRAAIAYDNGFSYYVKSKIRQWKVHSWTTVRDDRKNLYFKMCKHSHENDEWYSPCISLPTWADCQVIPDA